MLSRPGALLVALAVLVEILAAAGTSAVDPDALLRAIARPGIGGTGSVHRLDFSRPPDQAVVARSTSPGGSFDVAHRRTPHGPAVQAASVRPPVPPTRPDEGRGRATPTARTLSTSVGGRAPPIRVPALRS